jgi:hypothetical protein
MVMAYNFGQAIGALVAPAILVTLVLFWSGLL